MTIRNDLRLRRHSIRILGVLSSSLWALLSAAPQAAAAPEPICGTAPAIFCSQFEEGSFSIWDDYDGNPAPAHALVADPGPTSATSNTVARFRIPEGRGGADLVKLITARSQATYLRWYQKWETGYDFNAANHGSGIHAGSRNLLGRSDYRPNGSDWFAAYLEPQKGRLNLYVYYPGMYQDCSNPNGSCWGDHFPCFLDSGSGYCTKPEHRPHTMPPLLQANRWYCLEMKIDAGTPTATASNANGSLDFWVDGVQYGPWSGLWLRNTASLVPTIAWLNLFQHNAQTPAGVMLDNVVVSSEKIGCLGANQTVPRAPTDVRAE